MKIRTNAEDNTIEFVPERDFDLYQLGVVFGKKSHSVVAVNRKVTKVTVKISDIWIYLREASNNA